MPATYRELEAVGQSRMLLDSNTGLAARYGSKRFQIGNYVVSTVAKKRPTLEAVAMADHTTK